MPTPANDLNIQSPGIISFDGVSQFFGRTLTASTGISITNGNGVSGNPTIALTGGGSAVEHLTGDTGGQLNPDGSNNFNILTESTGSVSGIVTGVGSTLTVHPYNTARYIVDPTANRGNYTTIQSAINAAPSGATIFIRPGTYNESLLYSPGQHLTAWIGDDVQGNVIINGGVVGSIASAGTYTFSGIQFQSTGGVTPIRVSTNGNAVTVNLINCNFPVANVLAISTGNTNAASSINLYNCTGDISSTLSMFSMNVTGSMNIYNTTFTNSGGSTILTNIIAGTLNCYDSNFFFPFVVQTGGTGVANFNNCLIDTSAINTACIALSTASSAATFKNCILSSGTAAAGTAGASTTLSVYMCTVNSSNAAVFSGAGTLNFADINFVGTTSAITTTTQAAKVNVTGARQVALPAGDYTCLSSDYFVGATTSGARAITLMASPAKGQLVRIKDITGTANTHNITITPAAGNIDGIGSYVININYGSVDLMYSGTAWFSV